MGDIAKGVLGGGWALLAGWVLPSAINLAVFFFAVAPSLQGLGLVRQLWPDTQSGTMTLLLVCAVLLGLVLSSLQQPLYRFLEGYALWPQRAYDRGLRTQRARRQRLTELVAQPGHPTLRLAVLQEQLSRYPIGDEQIAPTRLGNAIRRFEEYGHDRYRLDTQVLWNELTSAAPQPAVRQTETARTPVDFFVALLYGHALLALTALGALAAEEADHGLLVPTAVLALGLIPVWYRSAVVATDEWAAAVRALVNVGRKPLADALGLVLPKELAEERRMWQLVTRMSRRPYHPAAEAAFAPYRADPDRVVPVQGTPVVPGQPQP
ncbi:hypothetical protein H9Y04_34950 [Streptomyces sp. TRM66268-LWL]|uniref:Uncharacterized protein n=1 Tax=Streptomyces polyasparticus TaxID=2767826 RepID=A0ABR7STY2_9ACTN|nr:hypothetical protein [Streptomyces polyasparticus]MBC9717743.1 hypothetical protein [Streptomyces polyasparticus]